MPSIIQDPTVSPGCTRPVITTPRFLTPTLGDVTIKYSHLFPSNVRHNNLLDT